MNNLIKYLLLFTLGTSSVYPTLWGTFVFDDTEAILKNSLVVQPDKESISKIFYRDFWGVEITHPHSHKSYRPFTTLTYRWDYALWGRNPFPFHLINLLIHGVNCCLVYMFLKKCLLNSNNRLTILSLTKKSQIDLIAFWASILFAVHPVHVEPLGGLVGRADLIAALIFLIGFLIVPLDNDFAPVVVTFFSIFGSLFKENCIVLSILYLALDVISVKDFQTFTKQRLLRYFMTIALTLTFVLWRLWFQDGPPKFQKFDNPPAFTKNTFSKIFSIGYIWMLNIFTLFNPIWLCYDWSMGCVKVIEDLSDYRVIIVILSLIFCGALLVSSFRQRVIMISCIIAGVTFLPSSNLIFVVGFVLAERNLYLPSIGYCLLVVYTFFKVCPNNAKVHYNLGTMYADLKEIDFAEKSYKAALNLRPDYHQAMNNLGNLIRERNPKESEYWLRKAVQLKPDFAAAWMNLGIVLSKGNKDEALNCYKNALRHRNIYPDCEYNLGNLYLDMGDSQNALNCWIKATSLNPTHTQAWINMVILLEQQEKLQEAKLTGLKALQTLKDCDTLHFIIGNILGKLSEYEVAKSYFETAIQICLENKKNIPAKYYSNLGVLYHRWGNKSLAAEAYQSALQINPELDSAKSNLKLLNL